MTGKRRSDKTSALLQRLLGAAYLVFLAYPVLGLLHMDLTTVGLTVGLVLLAFFALLYLALTFTNPYGALSVTSPGHRTRRALFASFAALALLLNLIYGKYGDFLGLFIYVAVILGMGLPRGGFAPWAICSLAALTAAFGWFSSANLPLTGMITLLVAATGLGQISWARTLATNEKLRAAQEEIARLAVSEERLRFARDLHDLLGHSLSLITLKSELAGRLLPDAPEKAATEVQDVERVAREALKEVREAVSGYRRPTLRSELDGAREMLEAAGVRCRVEAEDVKLAPPTEAVLAWTVREGVTNVIRHSRAHDCGLRIEHEPDAVRAEVLDDGLGPAVDAGPPRSTGTGLSGLAERVAAVGGRLEAGPGPTGGFRLVVTLPIDDVGAGESALARGVGSVER